MGRAPCCEKVGLKRGRWTAEEDKILANYIAENGGASWRSLPKNAGLLRCGKSCRLRWINYLRTDLKRGNISKEEEETIIKLHASLGNRWSLIADQLPGRTDNEIKNYWNSHLSRRIYSFRRIGGQDMVEAEKLVSAAKRKGGRTSRSAMKKTHMMLSSGGVSSRRENQDTAHLIPTSSSSEQSDGSLDPQLPTSSQCLDGWALCPSEEVFGVDSVFWDGNIEMEAMFEEREDGVVSSSCDVERESRDLKALDEGRDDDQQPLRLKEGGDEVLHSHLEAEACKLWDDQAGEVWPWFWESEIAELEFELLGMDGFVGYQE